ncbi:hypothetical protein KUTeg_014776 [Tegillarca granosa]|uniref:GPI ethanolamine phosphate transferase 2 n=1 Tax=Tegillarca granosa TaxID=220873 RepID=A0ABQ9EQZ9_TEGGR|nr:hypothetical protein KUTeg_014776 [Tegillarca granosa]
MLLCCLCYDVLILFINFVIFLKYNNSLPTLIMLCGDHGMSDQGSHGGASVSETLVPVVYIKPGQTFVQNKRQDGLVTFPAIEQIDVVPTLSVLLGLPIPQNNLGKLIDEMLDGFTIEEKLLAWHTNAYQVVQVFKQNLPNHEQEPAFLAYERTLESHRNWMFQMKGNLSSVTFNEVGVRISQQYKDAIVLMSSKLSSSLTQYDMYGLLTSIYCLFVVSMVM